MDSRPYSPPRPSTSNTYRTGDSASLTACSTASPQQPQAYGDEPPQYEDELLYDAKARERKIIFIRLLTSIFITVLVSLIVAAVVEKIHNNGGEIHHEAPTWVPPGVAGGTRRDGPALTATQAKRGTHHHRLDAPHDGRARGH